MSNYHALVNYVQTLDPSETNIVSQKNTHKIHDPNDPVNLLNSIVSSREAVRTSANAKLATIGQQMDFLVEVIVIIYFLSALFYSISVFTTLFSKLRR
jgi:hypothetical protein